MLGEIVSIAAHLAKNYSRLHYIGGLLYIIIIIFLKLCPHTPLEEPHLVPRRPAHLLEREGPLGVVAGGAVGPERLLTELLQVHHAGRGGHLGGGRGDGRGVSRKGGWTWCCWWWWKEEKKNGDVWSVRRGSCREAQGDDTKRGQFGHHAMTNYNVRMCWEVSHLRIYSLKNNFF